MKLIDNVNHRLGDDLKESIKKGSKLSIAASSFSIYAYEALKKELDKIDELRFIFTSPAFIEENFKKEVPKLPNKVDAVFCCTQEAGDIVFIPKGYCHAVLNKSEVMGIVFETH